jgi:hypothetical protein
METTRLRNTPSTTNLEEEEIVDAPGNGGNASMPEQVKRPITRGKKKKKKKKKKKMMMMMMIVVVVVVVNVMIKLYYKSYCSILKRVSREATKLFFKQLIEISENKTKTMCNIINNITS